MDTAAQRHSKLSVFALKKLYTHAVLITRAKY